MPYLLDANVFITGHNTHYGMGFCPGFWDWIEREHGNGKVFSIDKVGDELKERGDDISKWIDGLGSTFFLSMNKAVVSDMDFVIELTYPPELVPLSFLRCCKFCVNGVCLNCRRYCYFRFSSIWFSHPLTPSGGGVLIEFRPCMSSIVVH